MSCTHLAFALGLTEAMGTIPHRAIRLSEPTTLVSNWVLAAVAVALGVRLHRARLGEERPAQRLWAAAVLVGAAGAFAGRMVQRRQPGKWPPT